MPQKNLKVAENNIETFSNLKTMYILCGYDVKYKSGSTTNMMIHQGSTNCASTEKVHQKESQVLRNLNLILVSLL